MKRINFYLNIALIKKLKARSNATGYSVSELVRQALERFFNEQ